MVELRNGSGWLSEIGPASDVVMSCRARLARNVAGFPFLSKANSTQRIEVLSMSRRAILDANLDEKMLWVDLRQSTPRDMKLLAERQLISRQFAESEAPRAVAVNGPETLSIMVNEEDHLRIQVLQSGLRIRDAFKRVNEADDAIEQSLDYAFSKRWGYLTACPTNVGTGLRLGVMVHLPGLKLTNEIERIKRAARDLQLAVRGFFGEGSDAIGDFYQISNQITLGVEEASLLHEFEHNIVPQLIEYERAARNMLLDQRPQLLDDRVHRALGLLRSARLLGEQEAMKLLSRVRLGVHTQRLSGIDPALIDQLFVRIQPAHLQQIAGDVLERDALKAARATLVRQALDEASPA